MMIDAIVNFMPLEEVLFLVLFLVLWGIPVYFLLRSITKDMAGDLKVLQKYIDDGDESLKNYLEPQIQLNAESIKTITQFIENHLKPQIQLNTESSKTIIQLIENQEERIKKLKESTTEKTTVVQKKPTATKKKPTATKKKPTATKKND